MPPRAWLIRVQDMLACSERILDYTAGKTFDEFRASPMMMEAVFYNITIIGEAARHVPDEVAQRNPEIEWAAIRGMRNNLVHEYFGSDLAIVWDTIQHDIPALVPKLGEILREADRG